MCHRVEGSGNTGNGYNLIVVDEAEAQVHALHRGDLVPAPNRQCAVPSETTTEPPDLAAAPDHHDDVTGTGERDVGLYGSMS